MIATKQRLIRSWLIGILVGTWIIAVTSPLFVRSYVPLRADPIRQVWTLPPGHAYRWRGEGYATTAIGPLGMPGKVAIDSPPTPRSKQTPRLRVALWGDSQAEGVCVADRDKLFAIAEQLGEGRVQVFPLARSGEDAADWVTQMAAVEKALDLDFHVILCVDWEDLTTATQAPLPPPSETDQVAARAAIAAKLPAFVIQAARNLLTEPDQTTRRRLRFSIGPHPQPAEDDWQTADRQPATESMTEDGKENGNATRPAEQPHAEQWGAEQWGAEQWGAEQWGAEQWGEAMRAIRAASSLPILILDAPVTPQIVGGRVRTVSQRDPQYQRMKRAAEQAGLLVVSARTALARSAREGRWPHGFHNGQFGSGHLNRTGNTVVASILVEEVLRRSSGLLDGVSEQGD